MMTTKKLGLAVAAAAALAFATVSVAYAADQDAAQVKCTGANTCKGQSACKTAANSCKGQNACKGQGFTMTKDKAECEQAGGKVEAADQGPAGSTGTTQ